jgi:hypothetical protein
VTTHYRTHLFFRVHEALHSVNYLSSVLSKEVSVNCTPATTFLSSTFYWVLVYLFAECYLVLGKEKSLSRLQVTVIETLSSATVTSSAKAPFLPSVFCTSPQQKSSPWAPLPVPLPSASWTSSRQREHQWTSLPVPLLSALGGTRQRLLVCRVSWPQQ